MEGCCWDVAKCYILYSLVQGKVPLQVILGGGGGGVEKRGGGRSPPHEERGGGGGGGMLKTWGRDKQEG